MREKERKNGWMKSCRFYIPSPGFGFEECFISETLQRGKKKREKDSVKILPAPMLRDDTIPTELETVTPKFENIMTHWVTELNKIQKHSGEAPLFTENLLSAGKDEQLSGQPLLRSPKPLKARTTSPEGQLFYRPERSHRYLQASVLESTAYELTESARPRSVTLEPQLGRPTRSSLIRARQLAVSAPGHHHLRDKLKSPKEYSSYRSPLNRKELHPVCTFAGENVHSFLSGARYNRDRIMDFAAVDKYGLYLTRNKPNESFLTHSDVDLSAGTAKDQGTTSFNTDQEKQKWQKSAGQYPSGNEYHQDHRTPQKQ